MREAFIRIEKAFFLGTAYGISYLSGSYKKNNSMAEINQNSSNSKSSPTRAKRKSTKIDMTAMVDVAFLLLTFFVLTATMTNESMMEMVMPPLDNGLPEYEPIVHDKIMTLILQDEDRVGYYIGITDPVYQETDFSREGIRKVLIDHLTPVAGQQRCETGTGARIIKNCWDPIFVIKPHSSSKYRNLVDVLDELAIVQAPKYAIDEFASVDSLIMTGEFGQNTFAANE